MQDLKSRYLGRRVPVTIREVSRTERKITFNMVAAAQILAYRSVKVWPGSPSVHPVANAQACRAEHHHSLGDDFGLCVSWHAIAVTVQEQSRQMCPGRDSALLLS